MVLFFLSLLLATSAYAFCRGGAPERYVASLFIAAYAMSVAVQSDWATRYDLVEPGVFAVDAALFVAVLCVALTANRFWPICMTGLVTMPLAAHIVKLVDPTIIPSAYQTLLAGWSYPAVVLLAIATRRHQRRLRRLDADPSWSSSFPRVGRAIRALRPKA